MPVPLSTFPPTLVKRAHSHLCVGFFGHFAGRMGLVRPTNLLGLSDYRLSTITNGRGLVAEDDVGCQRARSGLAVLAAAYW